MKTLLLLSLLIGFSATAHAQPKASQPKPDLSKYSSKQLQACYKDSSICGTDDEQAISNELLTRLPQFSDESLMDCFGNQMICGGEKFAIAEELRHRGHANLLIIRYWREPDTDIREGILITLIRSHRAETEDFMRKALAGKRGGEEELVWAASYLAPKCDPGALKWLSERKDRPLSCLFWPDVVSSFGKCNDRDAIPYIVDYSIRDACLNIDDAGVKDLKHFFPHSRKSFDSMEDMQNYFCSRAKQDGFKVDCPPK
jgi:hypothetical protein